MLKVAGRTAGARRPRERSNVLPARPLRVAPREDAGGTIPCYQLGLACGGCPACAGHRAHSAAIDQRLDDLLHLYRDVVRDWGRSIESSDLYTFGHSERVAGYAVGVARRLGLDGHTVTTIELGAYLHDVGKVRVPAEILAKKGPLTRDELQVIQMHPLWGLELLADTVFPWDLKAVIRWHHERADGKGYPDGLRGEEIPLTAHIVAAADMYDALTTTRPYRPALTPAEALDEITRCREWWLPAVYNALLAHVGELVGAAAAVA